MLRGVEGQSHVNEGLRLGEKAGRLPEEVASTWWLWLGRVGMGRGRGAFQEEGISAKASSQKAPQGTGQIRACIHPSFMKLSCARSWATVGKAFVLLEVMFS